MSKDNSRLGRITAASSNNPRKITGAGGRIIISGTDFIPIPPREPVHLLEPVNLLDPVCLPEPVRLREPGSLREPLRRREFMRRLTVIIIPPGPIIPMATGIKPSS